MSFDRLIARCNAVHPESTQSCELALNHKGMHYVGLTEGVWTYNTPNQWYTADQFITRQQPVQTERTKQRFEHTLLDDVDWHDMKAAVFEAEREGYEMVSMAVAHDPATKRQYYVVAMKRPVL